MESAPSLGRRPLDGSELLGNVSEIIGLKPWKSDRLWACAVGCVSDTETIRTFQTEDDIKIERQCKHAGSQDGLGLNTNGPGSGH